MPWRAAPPADPRMDSRVRGNDGSVPHVFRVLCVFRGHACQMDSRPGGRFFTVSRFPAMIASSLPADT
jgi:hypothetical protein